MKLEAGKFYKTRDGRKVGPMSKWDFDVMDCNKFDGGYELWTIKDGFCWNEDGPHQLDLVSEWVEAAPQTGTLKELGVKVGDVVECLGNWDVKGSYNIGSEYTVGGVDGQGFDIMVGETYGSFHIVSRATDATPTLWRDMTPEEKGALLLAKHEGKEIEVWSRTEWVVLHGCAGIEGYHAYRIKPKPVVDNVTTWFKADWGYCSKYKDGATHNITFNTINGKPDTASIKMEEL